MTVPMTTTYLVTGASRGLGLGFVQLLLGRPDVFVYAGVRDLASSVSPDLKQLVEKHGVEKIKLLKIVSADPDNNDKAALAVKEDGRTLDVVLANAGICYSSHPALSVPIEVLTEHYVVNTLGPLQLLKSFQGVLSPSGAKFVPISSAASRLSVPPPTPMSAYGSSKAALNFITLMIHQENKDLITFPLFPGIVGTEMTVGMFNQFGIPLAAFNPISTEESVSLMMKVVDVATRESHGGKLWDVDGTELTW